jgi:flagellar hook-associated protein 3 FlgL
MTTANVSLLGQSTAQSERLADLRQQMDNLSREVTTGQTADTYSGLGTSAEPVLNLNSQQPLLQSYLGNISSVSNTMTLMNNALTQISNVGNQLVTTIQTQLQNSPTNLQSVQQIAKQGLQTVESMINQNNNGQYLFAGSNGSSPPFVDDSTLNSNFTNQINTWLATGNTSALLSNVSGFSATNLGLSPGLATSGNVTAQIGDNQTVDYTINADNPGFQNIIRALTLVANTPYPSSTDAATNAGFQSVMNSALTTAQQGVNQVNATAETLAGKFDEVNNAKTTNTTDLNLVQNQLSTLTSADTTTAISEMQALQTQLTSSYQVTNMVSKLSLVNYLTF